MFKSSGKISHGIDVRKKAVKLSLDKVFLLCFSPEIKYRHPIPVSTASVLMARWCVAGAARYQSVKK
jgi:hypothetical protein